MEETFLTLTSSTSKTLKKWCKICGEEAKTFHFGALTCSACAAFFRRTVGFKRIYACKLEKKCLLVKLFSQRICKYCRFKKCLAVGMQPCKVRSKRYRDISSSEDSTTSTISLYSQQIQAYYEANLSKIIIQPPIYNVIKEGETLVVLNENTNPTTTFNSKYENKFSSKFRTTLMQPQPFRKENTEIFSYLRVTILESLIYIVYTNSTALIDYIFGKDQQNLFDQAATLWKEMDVCSFIASQNGTEEEMISNVSDQFVNANLKCIQKIYHLNDSFRSAEWIKRFKKPLWQKILDMGKFLHDAKLDEYEFVVLAHLTLIQIAREIFQNDSKILNELYLNITKLSNDIREYYSLNYSPDTITKSFTTMLQIVDELLELWKIYGKHVIIIFLSLQNSIENHCGRKNDE